MITSNDILGFLTQIDEEFPIDRNVFGGHHAMTKLEDGKLHLHVWVPPFDERCMPQGHDIIFDEGEALDYSTVKTIRRQIDETNNTI